MIISLGHAECTLAETAIAAGARCGTHLFNAMSPLGNREPGLVGAALTGTIAAGVIADGIHVHPATLRLALKARPSGLLLVSDGMATAGIDLTEFTLAGRRILRQGGRLTLEDGTLAGADLTLPQALAVMVGQVGISVPEALTMATTTPARLIGRNDLGHLRPGATADLVHLGDDLRLLEVWQGGVQQR